MKAEQLTEVTIHEPNLPVVIETPDGKHMTTTGYGFGTEEQRHDT